MNFVSNIIWNSVEGFVEAGTRTAGGYAGDALIKAGDMIENSGRSVGNGIERKATGYGGKITGQSYQPSPKALPSTARKPVIKRSNSSPAAAGTGAKKNTSGTPMGAKKYPGGNAQKQITGGAQKAIGGVGGGVGKTVGGITGGAKSTSGGVGGGAKSIAGGDFKGGAQKSIGGVTGGLGKTVGGVTGGVGKTVGGGVGGVGKTIGGVTNGASKQLPKPYPDAAAKGSNLSKPYGAPSYPTDKKSAVRPGQPKPFSPPAPKPKDNGAKGFAGVGGGEKSPYPGTNTLPGQGNRTPVKKYKPIERLQGTAEHGKATFV